MRHFRRSFPAEGDYTMTTNQRELEQLLGESRKRGYVRRAELEAALRHAGQPVAGRAGGTRTSLQSASDDNATPQIEELNDLDSAIELFLANDVDIVDDDEEATRVQEDEEIESSIHAMETESAPLVDLPDESEVSGARLRRVQEVAKAAERGEAAEVDTITAYLREIGRVPMLSHAQEIDLAQRIEAGDKDAVQQFVLANLRLVVRDRRAHV